MHVSLTQITFYGYMFMYNDNHTDAETNVAQVYIIYK